MEKDLTAVKKSLTVRKIVFVAILLALVVITLGAYTRLTHAGLGCPDWPGCYGLMDVPQGHEQIAKAHADFPGSTVEPHKAWNEMTHRYFAGSLGLLILVINLLALKYRKAGLPLLLPALLLLTVTFQAALGMWTVTMKLMPVVVMGHLLGGFTTLCLLYLLYLKLSPAMHNANEKALSRLGNVGLIGIVILALQITLGGWTSSNYAALTCAELPICQAGWFEQLTFENSFDLIPPEKDTYEFGHLNHAERLTIHVTHRLGAIITFVFLLYLSVMVLMKAQSQYFKNSALLVGGFLLLQVALGISNIWFSLPLAVAVSHNVVAACLMLVLIRLTYSLKHRI